MIGGENSCRTQFKRGYNRGLSVVWTVASTGGEPFEMLSTDDAQIDVPEGRR